MKRRSFLSTSLVMTAGSFVVPTIIPSHVFGNNPPSDKINIGLIGCGRIAREHNLPEILPYDSARIIAVCDVDSKRMADGKKMIEDFYKKKTNRSNFVDVKMYEDYRKMLLNPEIDAVIICTPDIWHAQPAIEAALLKKDVYLQKPATFTVAEGRLLSNVVAKQGTILQIGAQCRSSIPQYRKAAELVRNGRIGKIRKVKIGLPGDPGGPEAPKMPIPASLNYDMWLGQTPEVDYTEIRVHPQHDYSRPGWLRCEQFGAGMITGWGAHLFDYSSWGMDTENTGPISIEAVAEFPKSGLWNVHGDFMAKAEYENGITMYTSGGFPTGIKYEGDDGWIFVSHSGGAKLEASDPKILTSAIKPNEIHLYESDNHHGNWLDCIKSRKQPISPIEMGHRACSICLITHTAMKIPGVLKWNPKTERFVGNDLANSTLKRKQRAPYGTDYIDLK